MTELPVSATFESRSKGPASKSQGTFNMLPRMVQVVFEDGSSITAPSDDLLPLSEASVAITVGDIVDIACKIFPKLCGGGNGGGGGGKPGCYEIKGPDGTTITICPPGSGSILA